MYIWLLLLVLVGGFAAIGFQTGAIRASVSLLGALLGLAFAATIGALLTPLFNSSGPILQQALPALCGFVVVWLIGFGLGFAAHRPVELHFKYKEDDSTRQGFERMNRSLGLFVGLVTGVILFLAVGKPIYSRGYITTQLAAEAGEPGAIGYLNSLRGDMASTGWDKVFSSLDRTPAEEYAIADVVGLIHANPLLQGRLQTYPPFLSVGERPEFTDLGADAEFQKQLQDKAGFTAFYLNPKIQAILHNDETKGVLLKTDLADFRKYLETGKSPRYDDEKLLGRWRTDVNAIITDARRKRTTLLPNELKALRETIKILLKQATLTAYPEGNYVVKVPPPPAPPKPAEGAEAATPAAAPVGASAAMMARYGRQMAASAAAPQGAPRPAAPQDPFAVAKKLFADASGKPAKSLPDLSSEGTWIRNADKYVLTSKKGGSDEIHEASISENGRLAIPLPEFKLTLFFVRSI